MPQTIEHLAIIDLLAIPRGIVALTKADIVTPERLADVSAQIGGTGELKPTRLEDAEILAVSGTPNRSGHRYVAHAAGGGCG